MATAGSGVSPPNDDGRPKRCIYSDADMEHFKVSPAKKGLMNMVSTMGQACASTNASFQYDPAAPLNNLSPSMAILHGALRNMETWVEEIPSDPSVQARFGNPAFRTWHQRLMDRSERIIACMLEATNSSMTPEEYSERGFEAASGSEASIPTLDEGKKKTVVELQAYLHDSFGQPIRLDYGTGHETSFLVFLYALSNLGFFGDDSSKKERPSLERIKAIAISITTAYLKVTRTVQTVYILEPAGSHGVWGLDDYHCVPFYFGACQLIADHTSSEGEDLSKPDIIHNNGVLQREGDRFLYFDCIRYIKLLKKGVPFFESSPMLNDISNLSTWTKVSAGLLKLYEGEVLNKRPVVQHFVFGTLFPANWTPSHAPPPPPANGTFRTTAAAANAGMPTTRAPWAK